MNMKARSKTNVGCGHLHRGGYSLSKLMSVLAVLCCAGGAQQTMAAPGDPTLPIYVDPVGGNDETGDGKTWETALKTITNAIAKTETWAYYSERRCQVVLKRGLYVLDKRIGLMPRTSLVGDPACDRSEIVLTAPEGVAMEKFIECPTDPNADFVNLIANLTISNVTMSGGAAIYGGTARHDRWSRVVSNVVFSLCRQVNGSAVSAVGLYADGRTFVTDCLFSGLTNTTSYGTVAICRNGGWFRNCRVESCSNGGYGQVFAWVGPYDRLSAHNGIEGCTFTNNFAKTAGGCIRNVPIVRDSLFVGNVSGGEGSVGSWTDEMYGYFTNNSPEVANCTFVGNASTGQNNSGGVLSFACGGTVSNCTFVGNVSTGFCGSVANALDVIGCTFTSNACLRASLGAGALDFLRNAAYAWRTPRVAGCTFVGNRAGPGANGGAILARCPVDVADCTFEGNVAASGGAMCALSGAKRGATVRDCRFVGNRATSGVPNSEAGGGALYDVPTVLDSTFESNEALCDGGAVAWYQTMQGTISNCVFSGNSCRHRGGGLYFAQYLKLDGALVADCVFTNNLSGGSGNYFGGAGLYAWIEKGTADVGLTVRNSLFVDNALTNETAQGCGSAAILMSRGETRIHVESCTMVANRARFGKAAALYVWPDNKDWGNGATYVTNTVIACNHGADGLYAPAYSSVYDVCADMPAKVGYSYLHPKEAHTDWWTDDQHVANTDTVPTFRRGTWIPLGSGLRDAGLTQGWMAGAHDLQRDADGRAIAPRVYGAAVDIGAFERSPRDTGLVFVIR